LSESGFYLSQPDREPNLDLELSAQTLQKSLHVQPANHPKTIKIRQTVNWLFRASNLAELKRNSTALIEIDTFKVEPSFKSCQSKKLWGLRIFGDIRYIFTFERLSNLLDSISGFIDLPIF